MLTSPTSSCAHGHRSVGGQWDMSPLLFEVEGTPCFLSPPLLFLGGLRL